MDLELVSCGLHLICGGRKGGAPAGRSAMGDHITQKFRALYVKAQDTLGRWTATQSRASALVVSAAMVIERLPELADDQRFGPLKERFPTLPQATRDAQAVALDRVMTNLQEEMSYFAELVKELDRLQRNAASLLGGLGDQGGLGMRRGPTPAVAECVLGLRDLWRIHRDELFAKRALVDELTCDAAMPDLEDVKALFAAEANLDPDAVRRLVDSILDATPDPQSRRRQ